jgi:hypothetical protein
LYRGAGKWFFKSFPVGEYHLPQMNSEKVFLGEGNNSEKTMVFYFSEKLCQEI